MPEEHPKQRGPAVRDPGDEHAPSALDAVLARVGEAIRARHLSPRTEDAYLRWVRRFVRYFDGRDPASMGCAGSPLLEPGRGE